MQETPGFDQSQTRFNAIILPNLIEVPGVTVPASDKLLLHLAYDRISAYFNDAEYRKTLTLARKNNIEAQVNAVLDQFQQLIDAVNNNNIAQIPQIASNVATNLLPNLDEFDLRFTNPYQTYVLQNHGDVAASVTEIQKAKKLAENASSETEKVLESVGLLANKGAEKNVADYYQRSVNGLDVEANDRLVNKKNRGEEEPTSKLFFIMLLALGCSLILGAMLFTWLIKKIDHITIEGYFYSTGILLVAIAYPVSRFIRKLNLTQPSGYLRSATYWIFGAILSVIGTGIYSAVLFSGLDQKSTLNDILPSVVTLLAPAYLVRFCVQNYKANKHIATINEQKVIIARSTQAYTSNLKREDESLKLASFTAIADIQKIAGQVLFNPSETGYLTVKEGVGGDNMFDGTPFEGKLK